MYRLLKILFIVLFVVALVLVRTLESSVFYDPLLSFFKTGHLTQSLPEFNFWKLIGFTSLRFWVNSFLSLGILWFVFNDREVLKVSVVVYVFFYLVCIFLFGFLLQHSSKGDFLFLFYVRRFLIQPLVLLLLLPAFYLFKKSKNLKKPAKL